MRFASSSGRAEQTRVHVVSPRIGHPLGANFKQLQADSVRETALVVRYCEHVVLRNVLVQRLGCSRSILLAHRLFRNIDQTAQFFQVWCILHCTDFF
jgi:hypothetical protein